ncbi:GTP-binding protein REM 1 isoform X1 [Heliangelus exortis]|uniref:GTP-binding protein REM 1 isoform X1 n=1 Tax=Heliangelus exortis TaxID=472823 RepID=UPI003A923150
MPDIPPAGRDTGRETGTGTGTHTAFETGIESGTGTDTGGSTGIRSPSERDPPAPLLAVPQMTLNEQSPLRRRASTPLPRAGVPGDTRRGQPGHPQLSFSASEPGSRAAAPRDSWSSGSSGSSSPRESRYRVVLLGDPGVGKTSLVNVFTGVQEVLEQHGEAAYERTLTVDGEEATVLVLDCWEQELRGEESWRRNQCLRGGNAYIIVYSITDRGSFESASELRIQLRRARPAEDIPIILVGNKTDLVRCREVSVEGEKSRGRAPGGEDPSPAASLGLSTPPPWGCSRARGASGAVSPLPSQRAVPAPWCSTASSSRRRRPCSTTWPSSSRGRCGRSACAAGPKSPPRTPCPARGAGRASPREPGGSSTGWWSGTAPKWPSKPAPSPATTCPCSESCRLPVPPHAGPGISAGSVAGGAAESPERGRGDAEAAEAF